MKIKALLIASTLVVVGIFSLWTPQLVLADAKSDICTGIGSTPTTNPSTNKTTCGNSDIQLTGVVNNIVTILSIVVGVVAVIMIIVAGYKYITSAGDASKITSAKNTLIYAIVGLIIASLAQLIVHTVLSTSNTALNSCASNPSISSTDPNCK